MLMRMSLVIARVAAAQRAGRRRSAVGSLRPPYTLRLRRPKVPCWINGPPTASGIDPHQRGVGDAARSLRRRAGRTWNRRRRDFERLALHGPASHAFDDDVHNDELEQPDNDGLGRPE